MANWVRYPLPPFLSVSPLESMGSGGAIPPPQKGYLSDTCAIPFENKANGCDTPLCDTISKGYCAIWGGISHWAAKALERSRNEIVAIAMLRFGHLRLQYRIGPLLNDSDLEAISLPVVPLTSSLL